MNVCSWGGRVLVVSEGLRFDSESHQVTTEVPSRLHQCFGSHVHSTGP